MSRKRRRHTSEQLVCEIAEGNKMVAAGTDLEEVCRQLKVVESTWHRWLAEYGELKAPDTKGVPRSSRVKTPD